MNARLVAGLVLLAIALVSGWSAWNHRDRRAGAPAGPERSSYTLRDFEMVALDKQGQESVTLRAPYMQSGRDESYTVQTPLFFIPDRHGQHWQMRSKTAWVSPGGEELRLIDDVVGTSPQETATPTRFETTRLDVLTRQNLAVTEQPVTVTQPGSILTGRGFEANLDTRRYRLKSQVKSRYVPKSAR